MKLVILSIAASLAFVGPVHAQRAVWSVGPLRDDPMHATVSTHAEADIDGDGRLDVFADCSMNDFGLTDNTWPKVEGRVQATLMVGARSYVVEAEHFVASGTPYDAPINRDLANNVMMSWPVNEAPDFSGGGRVAVSIAGEVHEYGDGAAAALNEVVNECRARPPALNPSMPTRKRP